MTIMTKEKFKVLAESNGWSLGYAEGFVDGESSRRRNLQPPKYPMIGIDEYCLGFRAGYFQRQSAVVVRPARTETADEAVVYAAAA